MLRIGTLHQSHCDCCICSVELDCKIGTFGAQINKIPLQKNPTPNDDFTNEYLPHIPADVWQSKDSIYQSALQANSNSPFKGTRTSNPTQTNLQSQKPLRWRWNHLSVAACHSHVHSIKRKWHLDRLPIWTTDGSSDYHNAAPAHPCKYSSSTHKVITRGRNSSQLASTLYMGEVIYCCHYPIRNFKKTSCIGIP